MKRNTELQVSQTQKKCNRAEELLLEEIEVTSATFGCLGMGLNDSTWQLPSPAPVSANDRAGPRQMTSRGPARKSMHFFQRT